MELLKFNRLKVLIDGTDYTNHVPFPFKWSALLDEQLDEATLELMRVPIENFEPHLGVVVSKNTERNNTQMAYFFIDKSYGRYELTKNQLKIFVFGTRD